MLALSPKPEDNGITTTRPRVQISGLRLNLPAKILINLFTPCDVINALGRRRFFRDAPYAYAPYLSRAKARTFEEKMWVIWQAKQDKTRKLIWARRRYGKLPARYLGVCRKTPCGLLRLMASYLS